MRTLYNNLIFLLVINSATCKIIVNTKVGQLRGVKIYTNFFFNHYLAFKGIPYAKPPVGDLRFRPPIPHPGWEGIREASDFGSECPSNGNLKLLFAGGVEDCLYLNVFRPSKKGNYPVCFWISGGGFYVNDGTLFDRQPDELVEQNVVVVTLNHRLSSLGFLSTGDKHSQGNYGLKDIVLALRWVQDNIRSFDGDPDRVTLSGYSTGGVATHYLLMSNITDGLFNQAMMMSGTAFNAYAFQPNPLPRAIKLAHKLGISFNNTEDLVDKLRKVSVKELLKADRSIDDQDSPYLLVPYDFVPSVEPSDSLDERLITDTPINLMQQGKFKKIPIMISGTNRESLLFAPELQIRPSSVDGYNRNSSYIVPISYGLSENSTEAKVVADNFRQIYFNGKELTQNSITEYAAFHTDAAFRFPIDRTVKYLAKDTKMPIFYYEFSYDETYNINKLTSSNFGESGAAHGNDMFYVTTTVFSPLFLPFDPAYTVRKRMIQMRANFVKFGNPIPQTDDLLNVQWPSYTLENEVYMDIGRELKVQNGKPYLKIWYLYQMSFTGHL